MAVSVGGKMPGIVSEEIMEEEKVKELNGNSSDPPIEGVLVHTSIEELCDNLCEMQSSDQSPSRQSFGSYGDESRIDSDLRHLAEGEMKERDVLEEEGEEEEEDEVVKPESSTEKVDTTKSDSELPSKDVPKENSPAEQEVGKKDDKNLNKPRRNKAGAKSQNGKEDPSENSELGRFLLKQAQNLISSGDNPNKALELSVRAAKLFEAAASNGKPRLEWIMCLHVTAAIHCKLEQYKEAIPILQQSVEIPIIEEGEEYALAKFAGYMQLGDTYAMLGQLENSISCYTEGLEIQEKVLGENDPRVGETCRYLAEALVQAVRFDEAEQVCKRALDIHRENGAPASIEEAADRRLMGLIYETKGDHENALEHLVLASMAMAANGQDSEVALVDSSIGDSYLSLSRFDEAVFAYQKSLTALKTAKGENHPAVGSVFIRLADLYNRTGKLREAKSYCENALRIYESPNLGIPPEEVASGLTDISAIYESMNELEQAINLLQKALKVYNNSPGQHSMIAGIEAQAGVLYYMSGKYSESYDSFKSAISKLRAMGKKKSTFFGIALNQMGLACVQRYAIDEAVELFEEAKDILEQECGPYHPDTLGVYSNLAGTYDAIGRSEDAIEMLEHVVGIREEKLGTANPDVEDEKKRLAVLLKEAGRNRGRKAKSLETLLDSNAIVPLREEI
ncbi:PREDICTED: kinesin light chain 1 isoform X3 [Tarenaya hassleriana]|uniref:kinesin light chain 1 isoform X3 n=1 Tax=Tarenaya hassleriana TaxID=28532 RepID=UPI00053C7DC9|nr:PREDICTED: kinesin light chain 1 isoform X3 [Tarenaya hassleriana]